MITGWLAIAQAAEVDSAELRRLEDELLKLAQRNTWTGVERTYQRLLDLEPAPNRPGALVLAPLDHHLGAKAALARGETLLAYYRLRRARGAEPFGDPVQLEAKESATQELQEIDARYGLVSVYVGEGAVPVLFREVMPFGQEERDAIVTAQKKVTETHAFRGLLPAGSYAIDAVKFDVTPGREWLVVTAGER
ncbi:MAG: hypothetical protein ABMA64_18535 [Myxococcota bacterium]